MYGTDVIMLHNLWKAAEAKTITFNVEDLLVYCGYDTFDKRIKALMRITNSKKDTVYSWINRSRTDVRIPLVKLCMIAEYFDVTVEELIKKDGRNMEVKFAVCKVVEDETTVIKIFEKDDKNGAMRYGEKVAEYNADGVINCVQAYFTEDGRFCDYGYRIFNIWESEEIKNRRRSNKKQES